MPKRYKLRRKPKTELVREAADTLPTLESLSVDELTNGDDHERNLGQKAIESLDNPTRKLVRHMRQNERALIEGKDIPEDHI